MKIIHNALAQNVSEKAVTGPVHDDPVEAFHAHLDFCMQCMENPANLCAAGDELMRAASGYTSEIEESSTILNLQSNSERGDSPLSPYRRAAR